MARRDDVAVHGLLARERRRRKKKKRIFANNPLGCSVITETFKTATSHIYLGILDNSKNNGKIMVTSYIVENPPAFLF